MVLKAEDVLGIQACSTVTWRCRKFYRREVARNFRSRLRRAHQLILNFLLVEQNIFIFFSDDLIEPVVADDQTVGS
jgi:hypothetical protein